MPKRQKEKQYQSAREHRANQSIRSGSSLNAASSSAGSRPLPFDCCALTLTPYVAPVCTTDGVIFDNNAIMSHLMKHKVDPVTGRTMTSRDLIGKRNDF
jgi:peptidyl-prolyl cis-trans isomerase-like protein 2